MYNLFVNIVFFSHREDGDEQPIVCEISPLLSYAGEVGKPVQVLNLLWTWRFLPWKKDLVMLSLTVQRWIQDFPDRGRGGAYLLLGQISPKTAWKWRKFDREVGGASNILIFRSDTAVDSVSTCKQTLDEKGGMRTGWIFSWLAQSKLVFPESNSSSWMTSDGYAPRSKFFHFHAVFGKKLPK